MVLSVFFNSRILQTGILQTGPNQFVENQKQNQDNTGRFGMENLPKLLEIFAETSCSRPVSGSLKRADVDQRLPGRQTGSVGDAAEPQLKQHGDAWPYELVGEVHHSATGA